MQILRLTTPHRELAQRAFVMMSEVFGETAEPPGTDHLDVVLGRTDFWALAAVADGEPVGALTAHALPMTRAAAWELFIYDLAVRPDWQRRGVGRALLEHLITAADPATTTSIFVPADDEDTHALDFYRAVGGTAEAVTIFSFLPGRSELPGPTGRPATS